MANTVASRYGIQNLLPGVLEEGRDGGDTQTPRVPSRNTASRLTDGETPPASVSPQKATALLSSSKEPFRASTSSHPDYLLRFTGIIRQKALYRRLLDTRWARYDARGHRWIDEETGEEVAFSHSRPCADANASAAALLVPADARISSMSDAACTAAGRNVLVSFDEGEGAHDKYTDTASCSSMATQKQSVDDAAVGGSDRDLRTTMSNEPFSARRGSSVPEAWPPLPLAGAGAPHTLDNSGIAPANADVQPRTAAIPSAGGSSNRYFDPVKNAVDRIDTAPSGVILVLGELAPQQDTATPYEATRTELLEIETLLRAKVREASEKGKTSNKVEKLKKCLESVQKQVARIDKPASVLPLSSQRGGTGGDDGSLTNVAAASLASLSPPIVSQVSSDHDMQLAFLSNLGDEQDGQFLSDSEIQQFVRQYFVRSIPAAAVNAGALIATASTGVAASLLSRGIQAVSSTADVLGLAVVVQGNVASGTTPPPPEATLAFSHVLLLEEDALTGSDGTAGFTAASMAASSLGGSPPAAGAAPGATCSSSSAVGVGGLPPAAAVLHNMVSELHHGSRQSADKPLPASVQARLDRMRRSVEPPPRASVPVVAVCGGGDDAVRFSILAAVLEGWPLFLLEGSGGYTDQLVAAVKYTRDASVSPQDQSILLHQLDPETVEIIQDGRLILVPRGQVVDIFSQSLVFALRGDETLQRAWRKYASWHESAESYWYLYVVLIFTLNAIGVIATGLSVFQTVMQVVWVADTTHPSSTTVIARFYQILNLVIIFLPLLIQLMQSVFNKINAGPKYASLHYAAESILSEMYLYRAEAAEYSEESVRAAELVATQHRKEKYLGRAGASGGGASDADTSGGAGLGGAGGGGLGGGTGQGERDGGGDGGGAGDRANGKNAVIYASRQELLSLRLEQLTNEVLNSLSDTLVQPYDEGKSIPPLEDRFSGDDGFSALSGKEFVEKRVHSRLAFYRQGVAEATRARSVLELGLHLFNTAGTLLGALATYEFLPNTNLQAWVAFTTSVVGSITRIEHWMLYEWKQQTYLRKVMDVEALLAWWSSRGQRSALPSTTTELCQRAEGIFRGELAEFCQQLRAASENTNQKKNDDKERTLMDQILAGDLALLGDAAGGAGGGGLIQLDGMIPKEVRYARGFVKDLRLDLISPENIQEAANDPSSFVGRQLKSLLNELNHEFGDVVGQKLRRMEDLHAKIVVFEELPFHFSEISNQVLDGFGCIAVPRTLLPRVRVFDYWKLIPKSLHDVVELPHKRAAYLNGLASLRQASGGSTLRLKLLRDAATFVDRDNIAAEMAAIPARLALEVARRALHEDSVAQFVDSLYTAKLTSADITPPKGQLIDTLQALRPLVFLPWRSLDSPDLLLLIDDEAVRSALAKNVSESKLRALLKRMEGFFKQTSEALDLERELLHEAVRLDVFNEILCTTEGRVLTSAMRSVMRTLPTRTCVMSRRDLLRLFANAVPQQLKQAAASAAAAVVAAGNGRSIVSSIGDTVGSIASTASAITTAVADGDGRAASASVDALRDELAAQTPTVQLLMSLSVNVAALDQVQLAEFVNVLAQPLPANTCLVSALWRLALDCARNEVTSSTAKLQHNPTGVVGGVLGALAGSQQPLRALSLLGGGGTSIFGGEFAKSLQFLNSLEPVFVDESRVEQLGAFVVSLPQSEILDRPKEQILKRLMGEMNTRELVELLRTVEGAGLKDLLCAAHAMMGSTFTGEIFDRLSFEMNSFNPAKLLNYEEQVLLMGRLEEFSADDDVRSLTREEVFSRLALRPVNNKLKDLKEYQLTDLLERLRVSLMPIFAKAIKKDMISEVLQKRLSLADDVIRAAQLYTPLQWQGLVRCLGRIDSRAVMLVREVNRATTSALPGKFVRAIQPSEWMKLIADQSVQRMLSDFDLDFVQFAVVRDYAATLIRDSVEADALETYASEFAARGHRLRVIEASLSSARRRDAFFASLTALVACGFKSLAMAECLTKLHSLDLLETVHSTLASSCNPEVGAAIAEGSLQKILTAAGCLPIKSYAPPVASTTSLAAASAAAVANAVLPTTMTPQMRRVAFATEMAVSVATAGGVGARSTSSSPQSQRGTHSSKQSGKRPKRLDDAQQPSSLTTTTTTPRTRGGGGGGTAASSSSSDRWAALIIRMKQLHVELQQSLDEDYPMFMGSLLSSLMVHATFFVFNEVARDYAFHDLRQVFATLHSRIHLAVFVAHRWNDIVEVLKSRNKAATSGEWRRGVARLMQPSSSTAPILARPAEAVGRQSQHATSPGHSASNSPPPPPHVQRQAGGGSSASVTPISPALNPLAATTATSPDDAVIDLSWSALVPTVEDLKKLGEGDRLVVLEKFVSVLSTSRVGHLLVLLLRSPTDGAPPSSTATPRAAAGIAPSLPSPFAVETLLHERMLLVTTTASPQLAIRAQQFESRFFGFDEKRFYASTSAEKLHAFSVFIHDDELATYVSSWDHAQINQFFAFLRVRAPFSRDPALLLAMGSGPSSSSAPGGGGATGQKSAAGVRRAPSSRRVRATVVSLSRMLSLKKHSAAMRDDDSTTSSSQSSDSGSVDRARPRSSVSHQEQSDDSDTDTDHDGSVALGDGTAATAGQNSDCDGPPVQYRGLDGTCTPAATNYAAASVAVDEVTPTADTA